MNLFYLIVHGNGGLSWEIRTMKKEGNDELESKKYKDEKIEKESQVTLDENNSNHKIHLITIVGEIEGHENAGNQSKVTKYELLLPQLASIEDSSEIDGVLLLLNTMGGDVEAGLAIAEMVASLSKPTVSLVLGEAIVLEFR